MQSYRQGAKVGIILPNLGASQAAFAAIKSANSVVSQDNKHNVFLFTERLAPPCVMPLCPILNISRTRSFDGVLVSTDIATTVISTNSLQATHHIFYVWDLEWLRPGKQDFVKNMLAFRDPSVKLIARSISHKKMIENYCNKEVVGVIPWFDLNMIYKVL